MMAMMFLPLLLIGNVVAGDSINDLCIQLATQFNNLEALVPLEFDVYVPYKPDATYVKGHVKYRIVSGLTLSNNACSVTQSEGTSRKVSITVKSSKAFIISPTNILHVNDATYNLVLDVQESKIAGYKKITVSDFKYSNENIINDYAAIPVTYNRIINQDIEKSLREELEQKLNTILYPEKRVEIDESLVKQLMLNIFLATAQDF